MQFFNNKKVDKVVRGTASAVSFTAGGIFRLICKILLTIFFVVLTTGMIFACIFAVYINTTIVTEPDLSISLEDYALDLTSNLLYENEYGEWLELTELESTVNRIWIEPEYMSEHLFEAAIAIEDHRFYEHKGVDWYRTVGAFVNMFLGMANDFGGSTITQQLIKNTTQEDDITVQRKLLEIFRAMELEENYSKDEILYWYLNVIYLGNRCYGVEAAAQYYFNKTAAELTLAESASIVGITNNPSRYNPHSTANGIENNKERQETILWAMYDQGTISYEEYEAAVAEPLNFVRSASEEQDSEVYTYYEEVVITDVLNDLVEQKGISLDAARTLLYSGGYQVYTCIDMEIQNQVDYIYQDLNNLPKAWSPPDQQFQSAISIQDNYTGEIVALSGGTGPKEGNWNLNRFYSMRQPGSSFKPVAVYGPAFDVGLITQSTLVNDAAGIKLSGTSWYPPNAGGGNRGITTISSAIISSLNTVAAQTLDKLSLQTSFDYLTLRLGFELAPDDMNYAPLSLGGLTNGTTVRNMAQAYTSFANDGIMTYGRTYSKVVDADGNIILDNQPETVAAFKPNTAHNITDILEAAATYGTGSEAYLGFMPAAGKTGTTDKDNDRYFTGYTPYYTAAVWTGYDTPTRMNFSGNPATQIWKSIMGPIHEDLEYKAFPTPTLGSNTNIFGNLNVPASTPAPDTSEPDTPAPEPEQPTEPTPPPVIFGPSTPSDAG